MDGRYVVAEGTHDADVSWVVWARRDEPHDGDLLSMIRLTDSGGRIIHVGGLRAALVPRPPAQCQYQWQRGGTAGAAGAGGSRRPAAGAAGDDGGTMDVPLFDWPGIPEVRFAALLLPREVTARTPGRFRRQGAELERFDLRFQQGRWEARHWAHAVGWPLYCRLPDGVPPDRRRLSGCRAWLSRAVLPGYRGAGAARRGGRGALRHPPGGGRRGHDLGGGAQAGLPGDRPVVRKSRTARSAAGSPSSSPWNAGMTTTFRGSGQAGRVTASASGMTSSRRTGGVRGGGRGEPRAHAVHRVDQGLRRRRSRTGTARPRTRSVRAARPR